MVSMKIRSTVTHKLMLIMAGFGLVIGIVFPFFVKFVLGLPAHQVLTVKFFFMCITAGLLVGGFNYLVFKHVIYDFLETISSKLTSFREKLSLASRDHAVECSAEECLITVKSNDPIVGNITNAFNDFITTIQNSMRAELITNRFLEDLKEGLSVKDIADVVLDSFLKYFDGDGGCIISYERGEFNLLKSLHAVVDLESIDTNELYHVMDGRDSTEFNELTANSVKLNIVVGEFTPNAIAFIPLKYQDQNIGIAILASKTAFSRSFSSLETRNFVKQATPFLYNSSLIRRLEEIAAIDELTRVLNRRFGMKRLHEEFNRAKRYNSSFSVCLIDVDLFKNINDTYGHQTGDEVLRNAAEQLQRDLRTSDFVIRYGGEEFLIVLPGASMTDAVTVMERIRRRVETSELQYGSYSIAYTFSGGVCSYPARDVKDPEDMVRLADKALYRAKHKGRNKILAAE